MVMLPTHRILLVSLIIFCVISSTASARSLRETTSSRHVEVDKAQSPNSEFNDQKLHKKGGEELNGYDLVTMDYTPAKKNPPIHN